MVFTSIVRTGLLCLSYICLILFAPAPVHLLAQTASRPDLQQYLLGSGDAVRVWVLGLDELSDRILKVDETGFVDIPLLGRMKATGLTVEELRADLVEKLRKQVQTPTVSIDVVEFSSKPVSVIGAVNQPGVQQLKGPKTIVELLSAAGGLRPDAGCCAEITRPAANGALPLPGAHPDATGNFSVARLKLVDILDGKDPSGNIGVKADDVVSVPIGQMVYVIGSVHKAGGFVLRDQEDISVLQALSLAEGLLPTAAPSQGEILRMEGPGVDRKHIRVNMTKVLAGKSADISLRGNDILFVPDSTGKKAAFRALEAALQAGTGVAIFGRY
jgi:polysaccharide export outer membrane protein